jgi:hypothetical protein
MAGSGALAETGKPRFSALVLSKFCNSAHGGGYDDGICAGYITGVADAMLAEPGMDRKLCMPRDVSTARLLQASSRAICRAARKSGRNPPQACVRGALLSGFGCSG